MKIAVLSGKGGTGKTFISVNLASVIPFSTYLDCDVEEPNGRLFFKPQNLHRKVATTPIPIFDTEKCTGCRKCVEACHFNALAFIKKKPQLFMDLCHPCKLCALVCEEKAVSFRSRPVGSVEIGEKNGHQIVTGVLELGEGSGVPLIQKVLSYGKNQDCPVVVDCPPGSACSVMESVSDADFCILAVESTAFGFHNFKMVYELCQLLHKNCGVVLNKFTLPYEPLETYLKEKNIPILLKIPYEKKIGAILSKGEIAVEQDEHLKTLFEELYMKIGGMLS